MRVKPSQAAKHLAYSERKLAAATDTDRALWVEKVAWYERALEGRCKRCGRALEDPSSLALGIGPDCMQKVAS